VQTVAFGSNWNQDLQQQATAMHKSASTVLVAVMEWHWWQLVLLREGLQHA
jgi:hypothetical protein